MGSDLTCIAWNSHWEDPFMFGTGSHDGGVRLWSSPSRASIVESQMTDQWSTPKQMNNDGGLLMHKDEKRSLPNTETSSPVVCISLCIIIT